MNPRRYSTLILTELSGAAMNQTIDLCYNIEMEAFFGMSGVNEGLNIGTGQLITKFTASISTRQYSTLCYSTYD